MQIKALSMAWKGAEMKKKKEDEKEDFYEEVRDTLREAEKMSDTDLYKNALDYFIDNMGYKGRIKCTYSEDECYGASVEDRLLIQTHVYDEEDKAIRTLTSTCEKNKIEWGILLHHKCMVLINTDIELGKEAYKNNKIVFKIDYIRPTEKPYLKYFRYENILKNKNTYYFRDIINYRNTQYTGAKKSWHAYSSSLRRFLEYMAESYKDYNENIYAKITIAELEEYILKTGNINSEKSVKNFFFYVNGFLYQKTKSEQFNRGAGELCRRMKELTSKYSANQINIYNEPGKIKKLIQIIRTKQNADRNEILLLLMLSFGMGRNALCQLKWDDLKSDNNNLEICINKMWFMLPSALSDKLKVMKEEKEQGAEYVLGSRQTKYKKELSEDSINTILKSISGYDTDEFYKKITVGNVRKSLLFHLLDNGYDLLSIMRMLDIDPKNLNNYIDKEAVLDNDWHAVKEIESTKKHPMEQFINDIIS